MIPEHVIWRDHQIEEAIELLVRFKGLGTLSPGAANPRKGSPEKRNSRRGSPGNSSASAPAKGNAGTPDLLQRFDLRAQALGLETEAETLLYGSLERALSALQNGLLELPPCPEQGKRLLVVVGRGSRSMRLLAAKGSVHKVPVADLLQALRQPAEQGLSEEIDNLMEATGLSEARRIKARRGLLLERLAQEPCGRVFQVHPAPGSSFWRQIQFAGLPRRLALLTVAHGGQYTAIILGWWLLGYGALSGSLETGWLWAWGLLLVTTLPLQAMAFWNQGVLALGTGALLRRRLLRGALQLDLEEPRSQGAGQLLGRVIEAENVERLALNGGFGGLLFIFEWGLALWVLSAGMGSSVLVPLLLIWTALTLVLGQRYYRRRQQWTRSRVEMTNSMVEGMVGHATRLAQQSRADWHRQEDTELSRYLQESKHLDRWLPMLTALSSRGWLLVALVGLTAPLVEVSNGPEAMTSLAISLGGILLAQRALGRLIAGGFDLAGAAISWQQVRRLFRKAEGVVADGVVEEGVVEDGVVEDGVVEDGVAEDGVAEDGVAEGRVVEDAPQEHRAVGVMEPAADRPILEARQLGFRYPARSTPILKGVNLEVRKGDQILLEGASGAGKSTFIALLGGLRAPEQGLLLLHGVDPYGWGSKTWRRRVAVAPQFHENHIFTGSLAFNLLMGHEWPPTPESFARAESVCMKLGLGPLLERMPGGLLQTVGETGWRLSHGERSRVYIARALLQGADAVVLDESFAALDPENLSQCLAAVRKMAPTLVVIAHP